MKSTTATVLVVAISGCSFSAKLNGPGFGRGAAAPFSPNQTATATAAPAAGARMLVVPDLTGLTIEQAAAALQAAGFQFDHVEPSDFVCEYADDRSMVKQGTACGQEPLAGAERLPRLVSVRVTIEHDTYEHGAVGLANEWRRMPDVLGRPLDSANGLLARSQLPTGEHFEIIDTTEDGCEAGLVCRTEPAAGTRKVISRKGRLYVGKGHPAEEQPAPQGGDTYF
jgi:beta-lactam-binding protein with PASTA domain